MPTLLLKILNTGPKLAYLAIFGLELETKLFSIIEINTPEFFKIQNFKQKTMRLRLKVTTFGTFRSESEIFMVMFEISYFKSVKMQSFMVKNKTEVWDQNYY